MMLEKTIEINHWASQGELVGLREWLGFGVVAWPQTVFHLAEGLLPGPLYLTSGSPLYLSGSRELGYRGLV